MPRNIDRRVEVLFPVEDPRMIRHIVEDILEYYAKDNVKARMMLADGSYVRKKPTGDDSILSIQSWLITHRP
jgi:polyphosphate kinase